MKKIITVIIMTVMLSGCWGTQRVRTVYVDKNIPVYIAPKPPQTTRPELVINTTPPEELVDDGKLVKAYAASVQQQTGYIEELEAIVAKYASIHELGLHTLNTGLRINAAIATDNSYFWSPEQWKKYYESFTSNK